MKTDPIIQENFLPTVRRYLIQKPPPKKTYLQSYMERNRNKEEKKGRKNILSKSLDLFKSNINENTLEKKSSKKQFAIQRQKYSEVDEGNKRKVFPKYLNQPTLVILKTSSSYRQEAFKTTIKVDVKITIYQNSFGKPSEQIVKQNDKKKMLPYEYRNIHYDDKMKRNYSSGNIKKTNILCSEEAIKSNLMIILSE